MPLFYHKYVNYVLAHSVNYVITLYSVPTITYPYTKSAVEGTMAVFDETVKKIMKKDFHRCAEDPKVCNACDFRFYCRNK